MDALGKLEAGDTSATLAQLANINYTNYLLVDTCLYVQFWSSISLVMSWGLVAKESSWTIVCQLGEKVPELRSCSQEIPTGERLSSTRCQGILRRDGFALIVFLGESHFAMTMETWFVKSI